MMFDYHSVVESNEELKTDELVDEFVKHQAQDFIDDASDFLLMIREKNLHVGYAKSRLLERLEDEIC